MADSIKIGNVTMRPVSHETALKIKAAANILLNFSNTPLPEAEAAAIKPGKERWTVKTVVDPDNGLLNKNQIDGFNLGQGYVETTIEELINIPRPSEMLPVSRDFPAFRERRSNPVETTIWQLDALIIALKMEGDGDYHVVLQGVSGDCMIGEVPNADPRFVNPEKCPAVFLTGIVEVRKAIDEKLRRRLQGINFVGPIGRDLIPEAALTPAMTAELPDNARHQTQTGFPEGLPFRAQVHQKARITGVGFFDRVHGQTGVAQDNGIELHPIIHIEWLE